MSCVPHLGCKTYSNREAKKGRWEGGFSSFGPSADKKLRLVFFYKTNACVIWRRPGRDNTIRKYRFFLFPRGFTRPPPVMFTGQAFLGNQVWQRRFARTPGGGLALRTSFGMSSAGKQKSINSSYQKISESFLQSNLAKQTGHLANAHLRQNDWALFSEEKETLKGF